MKTLAAMIIAVVIGVIAILGFAYSGIYDVSASSAHSNITSWLLATTSQASIKRQAKDIEVPILNDDDLALAGVNDFSTMCAGCHGAPGQAPEAMGQGLNPSPPDLAESALKMSPAELFWVTKYGVKMTGMPAWGATHDDDAIWPVVAFMTKLPELNATLYEDLLASAKGMGHHAADAAETGHSHDDESSEDADHEDNHTDDHQHDEPAQSEKIPQEPEVHDHSSHEHS